MTKKEYKRQIKVQTQAYAKTLLKTHPDLLGCVSRNFYIDRGFTNTCEDAYDENDNPVRT